MTDGSETAKMRMERIERLLRELEYEIIRGVMEREIEPDIHMRKMMPYGQRQTATLDFHVSPSSKWDAMNNSIEPRLRLVK